MPRATAQRQHNNIKKSINMSIHISIHISISINISVRIGISIGVSISISVDISIGISNRISIEVPQFHPSTAQLGLSSAVLVAMTTALPKGFKTSGTSRAQAPMPGRAPVR